jgi:hypothetical protein
METINELILSRRISIKSMSRHFVGWKRRLFVLDRINHVLYIHSSNQKEVTTISLISPHFSFGRHYYSIDQYYWLWIKYYDKDGKDQGVKEIILKFEEFSRMEFWEKVRKKLLYDCWCTVNAGFRK